MCGAPGNHGLAVGGRGELRGGKPGEMSPRLRPTARPENGQSQNHFSGGHRLISWQKLSDPNDKSHRQSPSLNGC